MAEGAYELARAFVTLVPSMEGSQMAITKALTSSEGDVVTAGKSMGAKFATSLKGAVAPLLTGAALIGGAKALYEVGAVFDDVSDTIRVGTGASGKALEGLENVAKSVGANVPASFDKIGPVVADLNTRLGLSGDTLQTVASQYLEAGRILGQDVDIQKTTAAFSAFKIEGANVEGAMDSLFRVSQATGVGMNDLADTVAKAAPALTNLGFSFEESASLVGVMDKAGINAQATMGAMQKGLVTLAKSGEEPAAAFQRVTGEIQGFVNQGNTAGALDLAGKIFGTRGAAQFVAALQSGKLNMNDLAGSAGLTGDTILGLGSETADFAESWQLVKNNALLALEPLGSAVFSTLGNSLSIVTPLLQGFSAWAQANPGIMQGVVIALGAVAVALGIAAAAQWAMNSALLANPIIRITVAIVAGIAALVAALTYAYQNFEGFRAGVDAIFSAIGATFAALWGLIKTIWDTVGPPLIAVITTAWQTFQAIWNAYWPVIKSVFEGVWNNIKTVLQTVMGVIQGIIKTVTGIIKGDWSTVWEGIKQIFSSIWEGIEGLVTNYINTVKNIISNALNGIESLWNSAWTTVKNFVVNAWDGIKTGVSNGINGVINFVSSLPSKILSALGNVGSLLLNAGRSIIDGFLNGLKGAFNKVKDFVGGIGSWIASHKGPKAYDLALLVPAGGWIMKGLGRGLLNGLPGLESTLNSVSDSIYTRMAKTTPTIGIGSSYDLPNGGSGVGGRAGVAGGVTVNQYIQTATVPAASKLESDAAASARIWGALGVAV